MLERTWARLNALAALAITAAGLAVATNAMAQTATCTRLAADLRSIEQSPAYIDYDRNRRSQQAIGNQIRRLDSRFVRNGCQNAIDTGQRLSLQCRVLDQQIARARSNYKVLDQRVKVSEAIAAQRVTVLQNISRLNCQLGSSATFSSDNGTPSSRGNFLQRLFGGFGHTFGGDQVFGGQFSGYGGYHTIRTVCVRKSDGYFWPISFSTLPAYLDQDAAECQQQCPNRDVALYYYDNPGQDPSQMISIDGQAYTDLPNAFAYRKAYDQANSCHVQKDAGNITIESVNGTSRAIALLDQTRFPMPLRDPRRAARTVVARLIQVPLPRPRPNTDKMRPAESAVPVAEAHGMRLVRFGDKVVRIVGPDTPYAQVAEQGS